MKSHYKYLLILFFLSFYLNAKTQGVNIVVNPGFENGATGWSIETAKITSAEAHSGKNSLEYTNTNPDYYKLIRQDIRVKPGQVLQYSSWVKGKGITTKNLYATKGAGIIIQGYDAQGKLVNNATPFTLTGTFDWKLVEGMYIVPQNVSRILFCLYFRPKSTGTVWFDDVTLSADNTNGAKSGIRSYAANLKSTVLSKLSTVANGSTVDKEGFTIVNGKRFFPLGIYLAKGAGAGDWASSDENLSRISAAGFNTILDYLYGDRDPFPYLSRANNHNLKVIYSLSDFYDGSANNAKLDESPFDAASGYVEKVKNSPNLLAYYISDENGQGELPSIARMYKNVKKIDPQHLAFQVSNVPDLLPLYSNISDVSGSDPYVISGDDTPSLERVSDWTKATVNAAGNNSVWQVVQIFDKAFAKPNLASHPPTLDEMRNMAYQSIIGGAKGLMFFSYHNLFDEFNPQHKNVFSEAAFNKRWPDVSKTIQEINSITPIVLKNNKTTITATGAVYTKYRAWEDNGRLYIMVANTNKHTCANVFKIPGQWVYKAKDIPGLRASLSKGNYLLVNFSAFGSGVIVLDKQ